MPRGKTKKSKRTWLQTAGSVANVATKALKTALMVKSLVNVEQKVIDIAPFSFNVLNTSSIYLLNALAQGTTGTTRIGDSVKFQSIHMKAVMKMSTSATTSTVRIMVIRQKEPRGAMPSVSGDILDYLNVISMLQTIKRDRYVMMFDRTYVLTSGGSSERRIEWSHKLGQHTYYQGNTGTYTDLQKNGYYIIAISDQGTYYPVLEATLRLKYTDD